LLALLNVAAVAMTFNDKQDQINGWWEGIQAITKKDNERGDDETRRER
jgi:hypothetical protein